MSHPLSGPRAKIARAEKHFKELEAQVEAFLKDAPYRVVDDQHPLGTHTLKIKDPKVAPVDDWGLLVGDSVHNLRSALDHLVWQLVIKNGRVPTKGNQFPIFERESAYKHDGLRQIRAVATEAKQHIELMQPFKIVHPALHPLWVIHRLDIIDKHQIVPVVAISQAGGEALIYDPLGRPFKVKTDTFETELKQDAPIGIISTEPPYAEITVRPDPKFTVILDRTMIKLPSTKPRGALFIVNALREAISYVSKWIESFDRFF